MSLTKAHSVLPGYPSWPLPTAYSVQFKVLDERIRPYIPQYATPGAAGLDLCALLSEPLTIQPGETHRVGTGLAIHIAQAGLAALILPRSGLGTKHGIVMGNLVGLIDSDYQGELQVACWNRSQTAYTLQPFERFAQLVLVPVIQAQLQEVVEFSTETHRGEGGFGSTGKH
jgi:dUTP pyrophosphatase